MISRHICGLTKLFNDGLLPEHGTLCGDGEYWHDVCASFAQPFGTLALRMAWSEHCFTAWHAVVGLCSQSPASDMTGNPAKPQSNQPGMPTVAAECSTCCTTV
jgi:hypothetical protein